MNLPKWVHGLLWWASYVVPTIANIVALGAIGLAGGAANDSGDVSLPILGDVDRAYVAWFGVILLPFAAGALIRQGRRAADLQRRVSAAEQRHAAAERALEALSVMELALLATQLHYFSSERISLFVRAGSGFRLVARYSANTKFKTQSRDTYALSEGCLGKAWESGFALADALPDPQASLDAWIQAQINEWGMSFARASKLTMKSRTYLAFRIEGRPGRDPLGVVIFESEQIAGSGKALLNRGPVEAFIKKTEGERLGALLEQLANLIAP